MRKSVLFALTMAVTVSLCAQQGPTKEVLIIGTMHEVPKVVKHSYKPLLRIAKRYSPDAIYVERQMPNDSLSLVNYESRWFLPFGDSLARTFKEDCVRFNKLMSQPVSEMSPNDFAYLRDHFAVNRDKGNWSYYNYLAKYGLQGSKKPTRNENGDLTARLAIHMDMNRVFAMDHQHETQAYSKWWRECIIQSKKDGERKYLKRAYARDGFKEIWPALLGRLGKYVNKEKTVERYNLFNRFDFRKTPCAPCDEAAAVWDRRNAGMATNIGDQMITHDHQKAVVIVGAGHLLGIRDELKRQFPNLIVKTLKDL